jgi:phosphatidylinositol-3-phosphatase
VNWQAVKDDALGRNQLPSSVNLPFTEFPTDDAGFAKLPTVAFVTPNQIHDGHKSDAAPPVSITARRWTTGCGSTSSLIADGRCATTVLIITWDEDDDAVSAR